jgi:cytoskeleton protein RodZ
MPDQVDWRAIEREATPGRAVGRLLRDQREARGLTTADIERRLRIRRQHIEAIEQGRFDQLPGAAYIPAFLRAYAAHMELDPEKVLTAYHLSGAVPIKRPVALPADFPIVERRAPIGLAVLTVLLVVAAGYAVWHYLPRQQAVIAEKVPPVPDRLLASRPTPATTEEVATVSTESQPSVSKPVVAAEPKEARVAPSPAHTWPPTPVPTKPEASKPDTESVVTTSAPPPPPAPPIVVAVPASPPPVVMTAPGIGQAQAAQAPPEPQEARAVPAAAEATPAAPPAPVVSLPARVDTPVTVRINSWVELRAPNGDILAMTFVRAGESYVVPAGIAYRVIDAR